MIKLDTRLRVSLLELKMWLLLVALAVWFVGWRAGSHAAMLAAIGIMVIAFLLRFVKTPPPSEPVT